MSVAIFVKFKAPERDSLYIPVSPQGLYHSMWLPTAEKLGLKWVPLFEDGPIVDVKELAEVIDELRTLRAVWANDPKNDWLLERIDFILEQLNELNLDEISRISIG
jgi:hypothetical protein